MKVCLVAPVSRWRGGIHQYSVHLANNLAQKADVEVISYRSIFPLWLYPGDSKRVSGEVPICERIPVHEILKYYSVFSSLRAASTITNRIRPDVVDIQWIAPQHGLVLIPLMLLLKARYGSKAKIVLTVHNVLPHEIRLFDRVLSRWAFRCSDRLLVHAEKLREEAAKNFGEDPRKISVVPHGICADGEIQYGQMEARTHLGIREKHVVLFFGFVRPYKGLDHLVSAFKIIVKKFDVALVIAGEFLTDLSQYQKELESNGIADRTYIFPRYIASEEIPIFFSAADLLVQPYVRFSGQSGVTQIGYLHSLPVVATDVGGLPELVLQGKTGIIVQPGDPQGLAVALESLLTDERKRRQYGIDGKKFVKSYSTWDRVVQMRLKIYAQA